MAVITRVARSLFHDTPVFVLDCGHNVNPTPVELAARRIGRPECALGLSWDCPFPHELDPLDAFRIASFGVTA